ncbi:penicillin-binding transpeptidase domain-containing protein [Pseudoduganella plicata]|uniref:penicillin-binding transpeptidase domain-containing protein n=1 Tax=Pseudoduganella plicata TaxID=321984 RepID=UPI001E53A630|nr:penicillin-binding transpeptidase domain-containing protein [Pseudoduganella plicata]
MRLDGGLLPADFDWRQYDALQATPAGFDPIRSRHELRQMSIGLRMQATPLQMAMAAGAIGQGATVAPRLLQSLDGRQAQTPAPRKLDVRLDRIRAGMRGVVERGTAAKALRCAGCASVRAGLYGKTGTAPVEDDATVWFTGWLEPHTLPGQARRLAFAVFVSRSEAGGGDHAAPVMAALLATLTGGSVPER